MGLDFHLTYVCAHHNITHNLTQMAMVAGIYECLWRPQAIGCFKAKEIIRPLQLALGDMKENPEKYKQYNASNGWGTYENFVKFLEEVLHSCQVYPDADIEADV